ncbi:sensor domain-containing diguanylate cyclase [Deinococcus hohokamensis]|uniref:Diguanylate cyclase n=1 Tax=Deinococcus hohokamensis TaxID=309883 RepID=A0ABV9IF53_9DEIO
MDSLQTRLLAAEHASAVEDLGGVPLAREVIAHAEAQGALDVEVRARLALAWTLLEEQPSEVQEQVRVATAQAEALGDPLLRAQAHCMAARVAVSQSDAPRILREAHQALRLAEVAGAAEPLVHAHSLMGIANLLVGDHGRALVHQEVVLKQLDQVHSPSLKAVLLCDVGANFNDFGTPHEAMIFLDQALALTAEHDLRFTQILVRENLGRTLIQLGRIEEGERLLQEGLKQAIDGHYDRWEAYLRCGLGEHLVMTGQVAAGHDHLLRATEVARGVEDSYLASTCASTLGRALRHLGRLDEARGHLEAGLKTAQDANLLGPCKIAHQELSELLAQQGKFEEALRHFQQFHDLAMKVQLEESHRHAQLMILQQELDRERERAEAQRQTHDELRRAHLMVQQQAQELTRIASEDPLTGLDNRRQFLTYLSDWMQSKAVFSVALLDADHFKSVNDRFGHPVGDQVLTRLGQIFRQHTRPEDVVARIGGEEFAILLAVTDPSVASDIADRIRMAVASHVWDDIVPDLRLTVSIGLAFSPEVSTQEALLSLGDARLYRAKQAGRDRVVQGER